MPTPFPPKLKLHHRTPDWVAAEATFHIRIRIDSRQSSTLTTPLIGNAVLDSASRYHEEQRWFCHLLVLMPDHLHALLAFPPLGPMSRLIGEWKRYHAQHQAIAWQDGYFDHRIRNRREYDEKSTYIRFNPVARNLCAQPEDWPWVIDATSLGIK